MPLLERSVGGDDRALVLVASADEFKQQIGMPVGMG